MKSIKSELKTLALIAFLSLVAFSCRAPVETKVNVRDGVVIIQGDKTKCKYTGAPQPSGIPIAGRWESLNWEENEKYVFSELIEITPQNNTNVLELTYVNYCTVKSLNLSVIASASGTGIYQITSFTLGKNLEATKTESIDGSPVTCSLRRDAGTYRFAFDENCLVIEGAYFVKHKI